MLLQKLVEYSTRLEKIAPEGYNYKSVRYLIELDSTGKLRNSTLMDLATQEAKFGQAYCVPDNGRTAGVAPRLFADDARYTLGYTNPGSNNSDDLHEAYMKLLEECVEVTQDYTVNAVQNFLRNDPLGKLQLPEKFDGKGVLIFRVDGKFPTELPVIREFWRIRYAELAEVATCMVCNEEKKTLRVLPFMIKGVPGDKANGSALLAANKEAFWSYGLEQAQIALICPGCADRFTKSINALLQRRETSLIFRAKSKGEDETGIAFVFWTREVIDFDIMLDLPEPAQVHALINSLQGGKLQPGVDDTAFYAVSLSATGARTVVRDWMDTTVGNVKHSLARWFAWQRIVNQWGEEGHPLGIYALVSATAPLRKGRPDLKNVPVRVYQALFQSALTGKPLSATLLQQLLYMNRTDHAREHEERGEKYVTYPRAALIKLVLASQSKIQEDEMIQLQTDRPEPAYHCGRLLAVLEEVQQAALGREVNSTIVDRFYGTASTAPATVFGTLLGGAQPHLSKLRRSQRENVAFALQTRLEEVLAMLPSFPRTLPLQDQALFALGYYHQRAYDRAQAKLQSDNKKNASPIKSNP